MAAADVLPSQNWFLKAVQTQFPFGKKHKPPSSQQHHQSKNSRNLHPKLMGRRGSRCSRESDKETLVRDQCTTTNVVKLNPLRNLVPGQVMILKRGEKLPGCEEDEVGSDHSSDHHQLDIFSSSVAPSVVERREQLDISSSSVAPSVVEHDQMSSMTSKHTNLRRFSNGRINSFSGASFISSPCPSFVPIPTFLQKEEQPQKHRE